MDRKGRLIVFLAAALLSLWGLWIAVELTQIHYMTHTDPNFHAVCALSEGVNCETVALSPYSVFMGLPVSVWGIYGYLFMAALSLWGMSKWRLHSAWPLGGMTLLSTFCCSGLYFGDANRLGLCLLYSNLHYQRPALCTLSQRQPA